jgi:hypothetical protein
VRYHCLRYQDDGQGDRTTEGEKSAMRDACLAYDDHLRASGHWGGSETLQPADTALTLFWKNGEVGTIDGPCPVPGDRLRGILILEARDMNHAVQLMAEHPGLKGGQVFEIRPASALYNDREPE